MKQKRTQKPIVKSIQSVGFFQQIKRGSFIFVVVFAVGLAGALVVTPQNIAWYYSLPLPKLTPPALVFSIVWPILYVLMSLAAWLTWGKASPRYFALQLICTAVWPFVFFYLHSVTGGLIVTVALLGFTVMTIRSFYGVSKFAAGLFVPQLIWSLFALYLMGLLFVG